MNCILISLSEQTNPHPLFPTRVEKNRVQHEKNIYFPSFFRKKINYYTYI